VVQVNVSTMEEYDALCARAFISDPHVKRVDSLVVMKKVKEAGAWGVRPPALR